MAEMVAVASEAPLLAADAAARAAAALAAKKRPAPFDRMAARAEFLRLMAGVWQPTREVA
jgi:beta-N-acetylhexosaminidase